MWSYWLFNLNFKTIVIMKKGLVVGSILWIATLTSSAFAMVNENAEREVDSNYEATTTSVDLVSEETLVKHDENKFDVRVVEHKAASSETYNLDHMKVKIPEGVLPYTDEIDLYVWTWRTKGENLEGRTLTLDVNWTKEYFFNLVDLKM